jgi:hypothetical protein
MKSTNSNKSAGSNGDRGGVDESAIGVEVDAFAESVPISMCLKSDS